MDRRGPGSTRYSGELAARTVGDILLLGFFLASGRSVPGGIKHGGVIGARIMGPWQCQIYRDTGGYCYTKYDAIMVFSGFWQLCPRQD